MAFALHERCVGPATNSCGAYTGSRTALLAGFCMSRRISHNAAAAGQTACALPRPPSCSRQPLLRRRSDGLSTLVTAASSSDSSGPAASDRLTSVLNGLDGLNSKDPRTVEVDGASVPYELAYARWLSSWVAALCGRGEGAGPLAPSEELTIAARGQHVERWKVPRSSYPEGRTAYLQWREDLKKQHAATTTSLMRQAGYPEESCKRVEQLILKRALKEEEGQILEDALCLVFLERQFAEFLPKLAEGAKQPGSSGGVEPDAAAAAAAAAEAAESKMVDILQKSWKKMGPRGRAAALELPLGPQEAALVARALAPPPPPPAPSPAPAPASAQ